MRANTFPGNMVVRCVDPVLGLVLNRLYRVKGMKLHPITGQTLVLVRELHGGKWPDDPATGYLSWRFVTQ